MEVQRTNVVFRFDDPRIVTTARPLDRHGRSVDAVLLDVALRDPDVLIEMVRTAGLSGAGHDRRSMNV